MSKETTRWQGLDIEPPTFSSEVQHANHYTFVPHTEGVRWYSSEIVTNNLKIDR